MLDGYLTTAYSGGGSGIAAGDNRFSRWRLRWHLLRSLRMTALSMCKPFSYRNAFLSASNDGTYSVMTQDIALLQNHT